MSKWRFFPSSPDELLWLKARAECNITDDMNGISCFRDDHLIGVVGLESWSHNSVTIHLAIEDPMSLRHGYPEEVFNYIFNTCDKGLVIGVTPENNPKALKFNKHMGLVELYRIKDAYDVGIDYVVQELRKENCKFLRKRNGQEIHANAA